MAAPNQDEGAMFSSEQKRLLALDGGGILGLISLQVLKAMEDQLRPLAPDPAAFRLRDFFDYIGGTSTGGIIAAGLALGMSVSDLIAFYETSAAKMFTRAGLFRRWYYKYDAGPLSELLKNVIGEHSILELQRRGRQSEDKLGCLLEDKHLLVVTQNISSNSPWPFSTNPKAKYNDETNAECNRLIPLWEIVRASTAAPTYFAPQEIELERGNKASCRKFEDGGVTPYNNPAFLLYRMATLPEYRCGWPDGEDRMMLVSVGTGCVIEAAPLMTARGSNILGTAMTIPGRLMQRISTENDIQCRTTGRCVFGAKIDGEIGSLVKPVTSATDNLGRRFLYARYDPDLTDRGLEDLGLTHLTKRTYAMDDVSRMAEMSTIGRKYAEKVDLAAHFPTFVPRLASRAA